MSRTERILMDEWEFALTKCQARSVAEPMPELQYNENFQKINLPHDWAISAPIERSMKQGASQGFRERWGIGWYRRNLVLEQKNTEQEYFLEFGGVYENCQVFVNGISVGGRKYGYSPFRLNVTEQLREGNNEIKVKVDNSVAPVDRWYSGCGIYRTVKLVEVDKIHLNAWDVVVKPEFTENLEQNAKGSCANGCASAHVLVNPGLEIKAPYYIEGILQGSEGETYPATLLEGQECLEFAVPDAKLWTAETPNLYKLTLQLKADGDIRDEITFSIGIRSVVFDVQQGMLVNGVPTKLKGVCLHQDGGSLGVAVTPDIWRERLLNLKKMGCNAIRTAHHMYAEEFLDLCDEMGFYVYEECFDKWKGGLYGRYFDTEWKQDLEIMVKRDRNRPSVVIWGVGNEVENQAQTSMLNILEMLVATVKKLDTSRPVSCAMNPHFKRESNVDLSKVKDIQQFVDEVSDTEIYDPIERVAQIKKIADRVDIISCNYQEQWYELIHEVVPNKLILGTEVYEYFCGEYHEIQNFVQKNPSLIPLEKDYCVGSFIWTGYDYLGESMGYPAKGWSGAPIHTNNEWRPMAYILQSYWSEEPMVHFSTMDYSQQDELVKEHWDYPMYMDHWHFPQYRRMVIPYMIATNCEEVVLTLKGKRYATPDPKTCKNGIITGFLPYFPGTVEVVGLNGGVEVCRHSLTTPKEAVAMQFDREEQFVSDSRRHMLLTVRAVDAEGVPCFRESAKVRFRVEGPAELVAVDNGDICSNEPYQEEQIHLYHGCASAILRFIGEPGRVVLHADGAGLRSGRTVVVYE